MNEMRRRGDILRVAAAVAGAVLATIVVTPIASSFGASPRKSAHLAMKIGFLLLLVVTTAKRGFRTMGGLEGGPRPARTWWIGFAAGISTLVVYSIAMGLAGRREMQPDLDAGKVALAAVKYVPLAFLIGVLEDLPFFGLMWSLQGGRSVPVAAFYALTHFLEIDKSWRPESTLLAGVEAIGEMTKCFARTLFGPWRDFATSVVEGAHSGVVETLREVPKDALGLFFVGLTLGNLRRRTSAIWLGMGVHGGWYWVRSVGRKVSEATADSHWVWLWGSDKFYDGVAGWIAIGATYWSLAWFMRPGKE